MRAPDWTAEDFDADTCLRQMLTIAERLQALPVPDDVTLAHLAGCLAQHAISLHEHMRRGGLAPVEWTKD